MPRIVRAVATAGAILMLAGAAVLVGERGASGPDAHAATRVTATPPPTPAPTPTPVAVRPVQRSAVSPCPQLQNPGGLRWVPSADAGPWATGGSVSLPALGVSAPIVKVGVNSRNEMVVPRNARDVAWLDQGAFPGDTNNAVLAGHIAYGGRAGSFMRIGDMRPGDRVFVTMDGKQWEFAVTWVCAFGRQTDLAAQIMGRTEVPSLTLITCAGTFDRRAGTRDKRMVVRAELVSVA